MNDVLVSETAIGHPDMWSACSRHVTRDGAMPETVDAKKLSAANPICTCKYLFLFRIMNYMHIPTENRLNPFCR